MAHPWLACATIETMPDALMEATLGCKLCLPRTQSLGSLTEHCSQNPEGKKTYILRRRLWAHHQSNLSHLSVFCDPMAEDTKDPHCGHAAG